MITRYLYLIILTINLIPFINAQGGWKKKYYFPNILTSACREVIETPAGNFIMTGITVDNSGNKLTIAASDAQGNLLWQKNYGNNTLLYLDNIIHLRGPLTQDENNFFLALCAKDSNNKQIGVLIKFDYNGDTLWQKLYKISDPKDILPQGLTKGVDGGFLITGASQNWGSDGGGQTCIVIKTDNNGNELWRQRITNPVYPNTHDGQSIIQDSLTKKIVIVGYQYMGNGSYGNILILDSLGNKKFQSIDLELNGGSLRQVIQLRDKNFLICGAYNVHDDWGGLSRTQGLLIKMDIDGNVIWKKKLDPASPLHDAGSIYELPNEDLVIAEHLDTMANHNLGILVKIRITRTDKNGNLKYSRFVGSSYKTDDDEYCRSMNPTQDGGFILAAWNVFGPGPKPYNIIKIDSTFCDTLESWCKGTALSIDEINPGLNYSMELFPNPARDLVTVNISSPTLKSFTLKVTDISGKEIEQIVIASGTDHQIPLQLYSLGVYFISLYENGRILKQQKLVVIK